MLRQHRASSFTTRRHADANEAEECHGGAALPPGRRFTPRTAVCPWRISKRTTLVTEVRGAVSVNSVPSCARADREPPGQRKTNRYQRFRDATFLRAVVREAEEPLGREFSAGSSSPPSSLS
jgi:hypothetical protein